MLIVIAALALSIVLVVPGNLRLGVALIAVILLLIPAAIQALVLRQHNRGRRLLEQGRLEESMRESEEFAEIVEREPWRKSSLWTGGLRYPNDVEAMTWNYIGVAALRLGDTKKAETCFRRALALDPEFAQPHAHLAILAGIRGDEKEREKRFGEAARLGM